MSWRMYTGDQPGKAPRRILATELQHIVLIRDGEIDRVLPPGRHRLSRRRDRISITSAVPMSLVVPSQEILTADGVTVRATVALVATIIDPVRALRAGDWHSQLYVDVQLALRSAVTAATLEDLMADRAGLDTPLTEAAQASASALGIEVSKLAIRDLMVPGEQRRLLAQIVEARLAGQAALERARGETAALRNLSNAAALLRDNPELYKLRLLQELANSNGNTFVIDTEGTPA
ncbi:MAG: slipin family protein [Acidimicrobiia bacterium]|nr:slipin family protein [Acidimicrobiia bacterium]